MKVVNYTPVEGKWYAGTFDVQMDNGNTLPGWKVKSMNGKNYINLPFAMQKSLLEQVEDKMKSAAGSNSTPTADDDYPF